MNGRALVVRGDALRLPLPDGSVDAVVCDPPYNLAFMGRAWDAIGGPQRYQRWCRTWGREALRVLKPGGWMLAFGGTRTWHRLACGIEDAGFEMRDQIAEFGPLAFMYGSGFPKSRDVAKAINAAQGVRGELTPYIQPNGQPRTTTSNNWGTGQRRSTDREAPATPEAARWQGWGTALKPAWEPIIVARKPLAGTVAANVLEHGVGGLNVDACRVGAPDAPDRPGFAPNAGARFKGVLNGGVMSEAEPRTTSATNAGRWPANVVLSHIGGPEGCQPIGTRKVRGSGSVTGQEPSRPFTNTHGDFAGNRPFTAYADPDGTEKIQAWECEPGCPVAQLDQQSGERPSSGGAAFRPNQIYGAGLEATQRDGRSIGFGDQGGASRFFYTAKADADERVTIDGQGHPTVKPLDLMRWLVRLVTPPGGLVLDPFAGSGTTGEAAMLEGFRSVLLDKDPDCQQQQKVRTHPYIRRRKVITMPAGPEQVSLL